MGDSIERVAFDRAAFEQRVAAHLKDDLDSNGRITPGSIAMIGAEAEFYAARAAIEAMPSAEDVENAARFLIDRLRDFGSHLTDDDTAREWFGHVSPAIARLDSLTSKGPEA